MDDEFTQQLNSFPAELKLLLMIIGIENHSVYPSHEMSMLAGYQDWDLFLELARHHRMYPVIYTSIKKLNTSLIPEYVMKELEADYRNNIFAMLQLSAEMETISKQFDQEQIRTLMLKGPILAALLYGDISLRTSKDLDILIPIDDIHKAEAILMNAGYVIHDEKPRILSDWTWKTHHISYFHPITHMQIEIHWRLNPDVGKEPSFDELWDRKQMHALSGKPFYLLGNEDLFYYLVSHGARHGWFRLRWLFDINQLLKKQIDGQLLVNNLRVNQTLAIAGQSLILVSELLRTPLTVDMQALTTGRHQRKLAVRAVMYIKELDKPGNTLGFRFYLFSLKSTSDKWKYMMNRLRPSSWDAVALPLPKSMHFLYYPLRPFLWIWRQVKQVAS